jgi:hypothetical protein
MKVLSGLEMFVDGPLQQGKSNNMKQLQGTIIIQKIFMYFPFGKSFFFFPKLLGISFLVTA